MRAVDTNTVNAQSSDNAVCEWTCGRYNYFFLLSRLINISCLRHRPAAVHKVTAVHVLVNVKMELILKQMRVNHLVMPLTKLNINFPFHMIDIPPRYAEVAVIHYYAPVRREGALSIVFFRQSVRSSVRPSVAYIANNSRTRSPSVPRFGMKVPHL